MIVQHNHFADRAGILKLEDRLLLDPQDNYILAAYSNSTGSFPHGFVCIFHLLYREDLRFERALNDAAKLACNRCPSGEKTVRAERVDVQSLGSPK